MFSSFKPGLEFSATQTEYPSRLLCLGAGSFELSDSSRTTYGFVLKGKAHLEFSEDFSVPLKASMYFSVPGNCKIHSQGEVVLFERLGYKSLIQFGGPLEADGRLAYIDGCRTTILSSPARLGDPVLNYLIFPPKILQSMHTHPSIRLGVVLEGSGKCVTPTGAPIPLSKGSVFHLPPGFSHCFHSDSEGLKIIAYHPESDTGPTDEDHPMLNRTFLA